MKLTQAEIQAAQETQSRLTDLPRREIPQTGLKPKRAQKTAPLALEMPAIEAKEPKLF